MKYVRPAGSQNHLFIPPGVDISSQRVIITEGELKAVCGAQRGLHVVGLSGVWNWIQGIPYVDTKAPDAKALIPDLVRDWSGQTVILVYDSDITQFHIAWPAFCRLAEQLYRLGAAVVKVITLPSLSEDGKTGLDDYILVKEKLGLNPADELEKLIESAPDWLPIGDGIEKFVQQRLTAESTDHDRIQAVAALLAKSETAAWQKLKDIASNQDLRRALHRDGKAYLAEATKRQEWKGSGTHKGKINPAYQTWYEDLKPTPYTMDQNGYLCAVSTDPYGNRYEVPLANFVARPVREIIRDNGLERDKTLELEGIMSGGIPLPKIMVAAVDFPSLSFIYKEWDLRANIEPGQKKKDMIRHAIQCLAHNVKREKIYTHLGWRKIGNQWVYLHAGGVVGADDVSVNVDVSEGGLQRYNLPGEPAYINNEGKPEYITPVQFSLNMLECGLAPAKVTYPLLAMTYLAPLCEALRRADCEPSFILWIQGESGARKTSLAAAALSHYGDFHSKNPPASFKDTANNFEKKAFLCKDTVLLVDDYHPTASPVEAKKMEQLAQMLLRAYGDRVGRGRMRADTSLRQSYVPRGLCVVTGEDVPTAGQSTTARYLLIELGKDDVNLEQLSEYQEKKGLLQQAMRGYIEYLAPRLDELTKELRVVFPELRQRAMRQDQHGRMPEVVAWLHIGLNTALDYGVESGAIDNETREKLSQKGWEVFCGLAEEHSRRLNNEKPTVRFVSALNELLTSKVVRVITLNETNADFDNQDVGSGFIGWKDKEWYYLLPDITYKSVAQLCRDQGMRFPVSLSTLLKHLDREGLIHVEVDKSGRRLRAQKQVGRKKYRVIQLKADAMQG